MIQTMCQRALFRFLACRVWRARTGHWHGRHRPGRLLPSGTLLNNAFPGVTLRALDLPVGAVLLNDEVQSMTADFVTTGTLAFAHGTDLTWGNGSFEYLRADFADGESEVTLDFIANDDGGDAEAPS